MTTHTRRFGAPSRRRVLAFLTAAVLLSAGVTALNVTASSATTTEIKACVNVKSGEVYILPSTRKSCGTGYYLLSWGIGGAGTPGLDGKSAYQLWLEQPGNAGKTVEQFFAWLEGSDGLDGADGAQGPAGADGADGVDGEDGLSAFELWVAEEGNSGKTLEDFLEWLAGEDGDDGKSAYELWTGLAGNSGKTLEEFFMSLIGPIGERGADGIDGVNGVDGRDGVDGVDGVDGIDGTNGADGRDGVNGADGRDGVDGANGTDGTDGADGADGMSAFDLWLSLESDQSQSVEDFFEWLSGDDGVDGAAGLSAFEIWQGLSGNSGKTEAQFFDSLKGEKGDTGDVGPAGAQGPEGPTGETGPAGAQGATGAAGPAGPAGPAGAQGATGPAGPAGAQGPAGPSGAGGGIIMGMGKNGGTTAAYFGPGGFNDQYAGKTTANESGIPVPAAMSVKNLYVSMTAQPKSGSTTATYSFTVVKNGTDTTLSCSITGASVGCSSTATTISFLAGDRLSLKVVGSNSPDTSQGIFWSLLALPAG